MLCLDVIYVKGLRLTVYQHIVPYSFLLVVTLALYLDSNMACNERFDLVE